MSNYRISVVTWLKAPVDLLLCSLTLLLAYWLAALGFPLELSKGTPRLEGYLGALPVYLLIFLFVALFFRLYQPRRAGSFFGLFVDLFKVTGQTTIFWLALSFYVRDFSYSRLIFTYFFVLCPLFLFLHHSLWMFRDRRRHRLGIGTKKCLLIGRGELALELAERLAQHPWTGLSVVGFVKVEGADGESPETHARAPKDQTLGTLDELGELIARHGVEEVIVAVPFALMGALGDVDQRISQLPVGLRWVPDLAALNTLQRMVTNFEGMPIINLRGLPVYGFGAFLKRALDIVLSIIMLIVLGPIMLLIAAAVRWTSGSPVLFRQERVGLDGSVFPLLKFRTMIKDAERESGPVFAKSDDQRVTRLGMFLRRSSLDELPQLFNVLAGQMSLVGPRPERQVFINQFKKTIPRYMMRQRMKAGITGWAQVHGWRGNTSLERRIQHDLYYMQNWNLWLDLKILALTLVRAWGRRWNAY